MVKCKKQKDCSNDAKYNYVGNKHPIYCKKHKKRKMINLVDGKCSHGIINKCVERGCMITAEGKSQKLYCRLHANSKMINVNRLRCTQCNERAFFCKDKYYVPVSCNKHRTMDMSVTMRRKCHVDGCEKRARFNRKGKFIPLYCSHHAKYGMIYTMFICRRKPCTELAKYCFVGYHYPFVCKAHTEGIKKKMIKSFGRCNEDECNKRAQWGYYSTWLRMYCTEHKKTDMVDIDFQESIAYARHTTYVMAPPIYLL